MNFQELMNKEIVPIIKKNRAFDIWLRNVSELTFVLSLSKDYELGPVKPYQMVAYAHGKPKMTYHRSSKGIIQIKAEQGVCVEFITNVGEAVQPLVDMNKLNLSSDVGSKWVYRHTPSRDDIKYFLMLRVREIMGKCEVGCCPATADYDRYVTFNDGDAHLRLYFDKAYKLTELSSNWSNTDDFLSHIPELKSLAVLCFKNYDDQLSEPDLVVIREIIALFAPKPTESDDDIPF
jgi:hypothetical protein